MCYSTVKVPKRSKQIVPEKDPDLLNFMMGHKLAYAGAYDSFTDEDLIKAYKRAERQLRIL